MFTLIKENYLFTLHVHVCTVYPMYIILYIDSEREGTGFIVVQEKW